MGPSWSSSQDAAGEKEGKREQVRDVRWAAPQGRASEAPYYFSLKQIAGQTAPLAAARTFATTLIPRELNKPLPYLIALVVAR